MNKYISDCESCPLSWEEVGEYTDGGCRVNEDVEWCHKSLKERQAKADELDREEADYWDREAEAIDKYYGGKI